MKKILLLIIAIVFVLSSVCYGASNNWGSTDTNALLRKTVPNYLQSIGGTVGTGVSTIVTSHAALVASAQVFSVYVTTKTMVLGNGSNGQILVIEGAATSGYTLGTLVIAPTTKTGFSTITLDARLESVTLLYIDSTYGWVVIGVNGATVA